jgi:serine/threonine protein kinase/tetratricopeptide (TPR) repeat protein
MSLGRLDHFEVLEFLGGGGIGYVYLAHDSHLDCDVALKVLREDHASDPAHCVRLLDEARALAKLDHPNIVGILDCGEAAPDPPGFLWPDTPGPHPAKVVYLAMRYVEGRDLSEAIAERRPSLQGAIDWAKQIARGLEAAHARGVVHRDLKPANIRVTPAGELKLVDFGLASSGRRGADSMEPTQSLTREVIVGTIGYSAPEQCSEAGHVDPRCDLFSLGVILYELVTGRRPFEGDSVIEVLYEIANREPPPMGRYARGVPDELERIVGKLLQKDPQRRYQSAHEVLTDLENLRTTALRAPAPHADGRRSSWRRHLGPVAVGVALVVVLVGVGELVFRPRLPETVAIAEFENLTGDPGMDRVAKGLGLDLMTSLVQTCRVTVIVSTLLDADRKPVRDPIRIAKEYGASAVLLGTLDQGGGPGPAPVLTLHLRIVRGSDSSTRWARRWDAPANDIMALIRSMTAAVATYWPRLPSAEAGTIDAPSARPGAAEEAYLRGLALFWETDPVLRDSSLAEFDRALSLDPEFGRALAYRARAKLAHYLIDRDTTRLAPAEMDARKAAKMPASEIEGRVALARILRERGHAAECIGELRAVLLLNDRNADAYIELGNAYAKLGEMDHAREYHRQSVELQPANPRAWRAYGRFLLQTVSDLPEAEKAFRMEIKLAPEANRGYETVALVLMQQCRYAEALAMYARRPKPDAKSPDLAGNRGTSYFFNGNYDLALKDFLEAVSGSPEDGVWRINLGDVYTHLGRRGDALREYRLAQGYFERDMATDPEDVVGRSRYAKALAKSGDGARARHEIDRCVAADPWRNAEAVHDLAMALTICGERERALAALDTLVNARGFSPCLVAVEDEFAGLHEDPRFLKLVGGTKH